MTRDEILGMEAGTDLDYLVAQKIFGLKVSKKWGDTIPCYSTDIKAAWEVVEELKKKGFWGKITTPFYPLDPNSKYYAGFTPWNTTGFNGRPDYQASGETAPEAIAKAALLTVMEGEKENEN